MQQNIDTQLETFEQIAKAEVAKEFAQLGELESHINGLATFTFADKVLMAKAFHHYRNHLKETLGVPI